MDEDLKAKTVEELKAELVRVSNQIRYHRDQREDNRCWLDDLELYALLPEGKKADLDLPSKEKFLKSCSRFWESRQDRPKHESAATEKEDIERLARALLENGVGAETLARFVAGKGLYFEADSFAKHEARQKTVKN